jgi:hypothetical protein
VIICLFDDVQTMIKELIVSTVFLKQKIVDSMGSIKRLCFYYIQQSFFRLVDQFLNTWLFG